MNKTRAFNGLSISKKELSKETLDILLDSLADWIPTDAGGLIFQQTTIYDLLAIDYFDEKPSSNFIKEIRWIIAEMAYHNRATILYIY